MKDIIHIIEMIELSRFLEFRILFYFTDVIHIKSRDPRLQQCRNLMQFLEESDAVSEESDAVPMQMIEIMTLRR